MILYVKAAEDGTSVGDCPFAQYVRLVLEEKGLEYDVRPCTPETKPQWLIDLFEGKMPALRHRKECYTESEVIAQYLEFFFSNSISLSKPSKHEMKSAEDAIDGIFPSIAKYLKHTPDGDETDNELREGLVESLKRLDAHLSTGDRSGPFLVGSGKEITLLDCGLAPKLYHMSVGLKEFKSNVIDIATSFPAVEKYMQTMFNRESFLNTMYSSETVVWGWNNARS